MGQYSRLSDKGKTLVDVACVLIGIVITACVLIGIVITAAGFVWVLVGK